MVKKTSRPARVSPSAPAPGTPALTGRGATAAVLLAALALIGLAFWPAVHGGFVYDDHQQIEDNPLIQQAQLLGKALTSDVWAFSGNAVETTSNYWRPLFVATLAVEYHWFGAHPFGWHLVNLALHGLATLLAFFALRGMGARPEVCAAVTLLFAVHPAHVESVAWISGSPDPLATSLLLGAFLCHLRARARGGLGTRGGALALFAAALLCKEIAIVFPLVVFGSELVLDSGDHLPRRKPRRSPFGPALRAALPYLAVTAVYLAIRVALVGMTHVIPPGAPGLDGVVLTAPALLLFYLRRIFLPLHPGPSYPLAPVATASLHDFVLPLVAAAILALGAWWLSRRQRVERLALLWFLLPLAPVFDVRSFIPEDVAHDRYLYLPLFGALAFAFAAATAALERRLAPSRVAAVVAGGGLGLALVLLPVTRATTAVWTSDVTLWEAGIHSNPHTAFPHVQLADAYRRAGRIAEARQQLAQALALNPGVTAARLGLAALDRQAGHLAEAEQNVRVVLTHFPDLAPAIELLGLVYQDEGRYEEAIPLFERGRRALPYRRALYTVNLAVLDRLTGRAAASRRELESLVPELPATRDPKVLSAWFYLGDLHREVGEVAPAIDCYRRYLAATEGLDPREVARLRQAAAVALQSLGAGP